MSLVKTQPNYELNILVVDDDAMVLEVVVCYLKSFGFNNITAKSDPKMVLHEFSIGKKNYDLIISDWEMPGATGLTLLQNVKNDLDFENTKFVLITSQQSMERMKVARAAKAGVDGYLMKPFRSRFLKEKIWEIYNWLEEGNDSGDKEKSA